VVGEQRVYYSSLESSMKLNQRTSVTSSTIAVKIERIKKANDAMSGDPRLDGGIRLSQPFNMIKVIAELADKRSDTFRGNTAISANYTRNDHSAIVARLMAAIGRYSQTGKMTFEQLSGNNYDIHNRDKVDGRIEKGSDLIYIPRLTSVDSESFMWYAVIGAAMGCGNKVITDATAVDDQNRVLLNAPSNSQLIMGCIEALSRMANYYALSKATVLFAFAAMKGAHEEMSLVGHTDEGAYIRSVVRRNRFSKSYGVIWSNTSRSPALPVPTAITVDAAAKFFDSVLMYSGACSAVCDPLVKCGEDYYPSVFTAGLTDSTINVPDNPTAEEERQWCSEHAKNISDACGGWASSMAEMLDAMLKGASDREYKNSVSGFLVNNFGSMANSDDRHIRHKVVAPFYWIEPQNIIGSEAKERKATKHGYGVFCEVDEFSKEVDPFEPGSNQVGTGNPMSGAFYIALTAARKNPAIQHLLNNDAGGLQCFVPRQTREDGLTLVGHRRNRGSFVERCATGDDLESYLWRHATCNTIAPAEMLQLQKGMAVVLVAARFDEETYSHERLFQGNLCDLTNKVTYRPTSWIGLGIRKRNEPFPREVVRNCSLSAKALDTNRSLVGVIGDGFTTMPVSNSGTDPGANVILQSMQDPRRLIVTGEDPSDVWEKVAGKVQTTVVSHRLRHRRRVKANERKVIGAGAEEVGGTEDVQTPIASEQDELHALIDKYNKMENADIDKITDTPPYGKKKEKKIFKPDVETDTTPEGQIVLDKNVTINLEKKFIESLRGAVRYTPLSHVHLLHRGIYNACETLKDEDYHPATFRVARRLGFTGIHALIPTKVFMFALCDKGSVDWTKEELIEKFTKMYDEENEGGDDSSSSSSNRSDSENSYSDND
jgi:hypothetical protein